MAQIELKHPFEGGGDTVGCQVCGHEEHLHPQPAPDPRDEFRDTLLLLINLTNGQRIGLVNNRTSKLLTADNIRERNRAIQARLEALVDLVWDPRRLS